MPIDEGDLPMHVQVAPAITPRPADDQARRLRGRWLVVARVAWVAVALLTVVYFVASLPYMFAQLQQVCADPRCPPAALGPAHVHELAAMGLSTAFFAGSLVALGGLFTVVSFAVGTIIFWHKSDDRMALLVALALVTFGGIYLSGSHDPLAAQSVVWRVVVAVLRFLGNTPGLVAGFVLAAAAAQVYRYAWVATPLQRQQTKWLALGFTFAVVSIVAAGVGFSALGRPSVLLVLAVYALITLGMLCLPLSIGIAILRYRLWDIDILINRALVYGALTASVVAIYVFVVGYLGALVAQGAPARANLAISLVATGIVAVLFQPLRDRLQRGVNHLLYGARDEPYAVLAHLGQRLDSPLAADAVLPAIVETVREALKLPYVALVLDRAGAAALARQAGVAAYAVRLTADLQRSRERLVLAREEERRRLRNDLHDGLGPQLASLTLKIQTARLRLGHDPLAETVLTELAARTQAAVADIRRVVYDLRPPALDELGLLSALHESAAQHQGQEPGGVQIRIEAPEHVPPLPAAVEVAAYRIANEALTNVVKHAAARTCALRLSVDAPAGTLRIEVQDDGRGIPPEHRRGVGLISMRERAAELGGMLTVEAVRAGGTLVRARLPLE